MPIFEYHCADCQEDFEEIRSFSDRDKNVICPKCKSRRIERKVSLFSSCGSGVTSGSSCGSGGGFT